MGTKCGKWPLLQLLERGAEVEVLTRQRTQQRKKVAFVSGEISRFRREPTAADWGLEHQQKAVNQGKISASVSSDSAIRWIISK